MHRAPWSIARATAVLDLGEIMICGLDFPKYFLINSLITRSNF
jgi:hypothetical protein